MIRRCFFGVGKFKGPIRIKPDLSIRRRKKPRSSVAKATLVPSSKKSGEEAANEDMKWSTINFVDNRLYGRLKGLDFRRTNYKPPLQFSSGQTQN